MKKDNTFKRPVSKRQKNKGESRSFSKPQGYGALNFDRPKKQEEKIDLASIISHTGKRTNKKLPELLAPAGSLDSLKAAIAGGADAVYFGGGDFNARINAKNFTNEELKEAIDLLHSCGKKAYITLNTLVHERELEDYLRFAEYVYLAGVDALIVADLGGALALRRHLPDLELHASTQMSGHNLAEAKLLSELGFSRMVCARELSKEDMSALVDSSPIEIEAFVHGALCVCHSGQCLFSSLVGGRSGNRGECAQPCRLPYSDKNGEGGYPLSLKDLSLASYVTDLIDMGVHSLKIEGRMKSPEYVFGVVRAFRTLLDEGRNATPTELDALAKVFSRGGFTDGYYKKRIDSSMLGVRSDEQKQFSRLSLTSSERLDNTPTLKKEISAHAVVRIGEPIALTLECEGISVTAKGDDPELAHNAPLSPESVQKSLSKLGATDFVIANYSSDVDKGVIVPVSSLNALRRCAVEMLENELKATKPKRTGFDRYAPTVSDNSKKAQISARFYRPEQITDKAREFFDVIYLPLDKYNGQCEGVILPPVIFDSEKQAVDKMLEKARSLGAKLALVGNLGAIELAKKHGLEMHGDLRFNVYNNESVSALEKLDIKSVMLSPELTLPQIRDLKGDTSAVIYGRIPLMLLEKCVGKELGSCESCERGDITLTDRRGVSFPTLREYPHRSVVYNSAPTYMADRENELARASVTNRHFIFSTETESEVDAIIEAYISHTPSKEGEKIRRI